MELLLFNENHQITYFGECTIKANAMNGHLNVTPIEEDFKVYPYIFKQDVIKQNNFFFVFASNLYPSDFVLIFPSIQSCNKIFKVTQKAKDPNKNQTSNAIDIHSADFQQRFFIPILENFQTNESMSLRLKKFICIILKSIGKNEREKYLFMIKEKSFELYSEILKKGGFDQICRDDTIPEVVVDEANISTNFELAETGRRLRKRRRNVVETESKNGENDSSDDETNQIEESDISFSDEDFEDESEIFVNRRLPKKLKNDSVSGMVEAPNYKLLEYDEYGTLRKKLIIFPHDDKTFCYVYGWDNTEECYKCWRCATYRKKLRECHRTAIICQNEKKEIYVKLLQTQHLCEMKKYEPEKYTFDASKQIVHEPNFKIFNYEEIGATPKSKLVIFPNNNQELCYEYKGRKCRGKFFTYYCVGCRRSSISYATICKKESTNEIYLKLNKKEHNCEMIKFDPEKYKFNEADRTVKAPNFKIDSFKRNGVQKKNLFIFTSFNEKLGYKYYYNNNEEKFYCCGCKSQNVRPTAKMYENNNGEECIKLNKAKHVCEIRNYDLCSGIDYKIFYKPDYQIIDKTILGKKIKKLFVRIQEHKNLCYEFTFKQQDKNFRCNRCRTGVEHQNNIRAYICYDEEGKEFVSVYDRPHLCQPLPYPLNNSENENIIGPLNYKFLKRKVKGKLVEKLVIFVNEEKNLCYEYTQSSKDYWICFICKHQKKKTISAKLIHGQEEYIELGKNTHYCEPIKFLPEDIELNIVKKPNFKVEIGKINFRNKESKRLTIFDQNDQTMCYYYLPNKGERNFRCIKCDRKNKYLSATICTEESGEEYVLMNDNKHVCQIQKYVPLHSSFKTVNEPNFYFEKCTRQKFDFLLVRDEKESNLWYTYGYCTDNDVYVCKKCRKNKKYVAAKLCKVQDGEDYIELGPNPHVCKPESKNKNQ